MVFAVLLSICAAQKQGNSRMPESLCLWKRVGLHSAIFRKDVLQLLGLCLTPRAKWLWSAKDRLAFARVRARSFPAESARRPTKSDPDPAARPPHRCFPGEPQCATHLVPSEPEVRELQTRREEVVPARVRAAALRRRAQNASIPLLWSRYTPH